MQAIFKILDHVWSLKFIKGYRTLTARVFLIVASAYQFLASLKPLIDAGIDLPDLPAEVYTALVAYIGIKVTQFAQEHKP